LAATDGGHAENAGAFFGGSTAFATAIADMPKMQEHFSAGQRSLQPQWRTCRKCRSIFRRVNGLCNRNSGHAENAGAFFGGATVFATAMAVMPKMQEHFSAGQWSLQPQ
jgi:hypothetical protein